LTCKLGHCLHDLKLSCIISLNVNIADALEKHNNESVQRKPLNVFVQIPGVMERTRDL